MHLYEIGKGICDRLLGLPVLQREWLLLGKSVDYLIQQGKSLKQLNSNQWRDCVTNESYYIYPPTDAHDGAIDFQSMLEAHLAMADITLHTFAEDERGNLIDLFNAKEDMESGSIRYASASFSDDLQNIFNVALASAKLRHIGFRLTHGTNALLKKMVRNEHFKLIDSEVLSDAFQEAMHYTQPAEFFRVLHSCGALASICPTMDTLFDGVSTHDEDDSLPAQMIVLNQLKSNSQVDPVTNIRIACGELTDRICFEFGVAG